MKNRREEFKNLKERNEWFDSLKPAEKRVEVARDLILSLKAGTFHPYGGYFSSECTVPQTNSSRCTPRRIRTF
ncbi:MAG: hypothetical protein AAF620_15325 [Bacteroidota bacterium]